MESDEPHWLNTTQQDTTEISYCYCKSHSSSRSIRTCARSSAVVVKPIVLRTTYSIVTDHCHGIAVVSMSIYLFAVSNLSLLLMLKVCCRCLSAFSRLPCFVAKQYIVQQKRLKTYPARNRTAQLWTPYTTLSAAVHSVTDRWTDRRHHHAKSRSYCMQKRCTAILWPS